MRKYPRKSLGEIIEFCNYPHEIVVRGKKPGVNVTHLSFDIKHNQDVIFTLVTVTCDSRLVTHVHVDSFKGGRSLYAHLDDSDVYENQTIYNVVV